MAKRKSKEPENPFVYKGYEGEKYFCDRTEESERIISALENGSNITLISPRRIGKTGLIKHVFQQIKKVHKDAICIYIDVFSTQNLHEFVEMLGGAIVQEAILREKSVLARALDAFRGWRPVVSADPLTGAPSVSVSIEPTHTEYTIKSIFEHLENIDKPVFIGIDEFQQIACYPEKGAEALLRSYIQFSHAGFIFSGSRQHLMTEIFASPKRPFYQSTQFVSLCPLHEEIYYDFARSFFEARKIDFAPDVFHAIYERFAGYTWYIQLVLNLLYRTKSRTIDVQMVTEAIDDLLGTMSPQYEGLMSLLTQNQFNLLRVIAKVGKVAQPQSGEFLRRYHLGSASSVNSALSALTEKELIYKQTDGYIIYDRFLSIWLQRFS